MIILLLFKNNCSYSKTYKLYFSRNSSYYSSYFVHIQALTWKILVYTGTTNRAHKTVRQDAVSYGVPINDKMLTTNAIYSVGKTELPLTTITIFHTLFIFNDLRRTPLNYSKNTAKSRRRSLLYCVVQLVQRSTLILTYYVKSA